MGPGDLRGGAGAVDRTTPPWRGREQGEGAGEVEAQKEQDGTKAAHRDDLSSHADSCGRDTVRGNTIRFWTGTKEISVKKLPFASRYSWVLILMLILILILPPTAFEWILAARAATS